MPGGEAQIFRLSTFPHEFLHPGILFDHACPFDIALNGNAPSEDQRVSNFQLKSEGLSNLLGGSQRNVTAV